MKKVLTALGMLGLTCLATTGHAQDPYANLITNPNTELVVFVPIKIEGDREKITSGMSIYCQLFVMNDDTGRWERKAAVYNTLAEKGEVLQPNTADGIFLDRFGFELSRHVPEGVETARFKWNCQLHRGPVISGAAKADRPRFVENGRPVRPATYGTCDFVEGYVSWPALENTGYYRRQCLK